MELDLTAGEEASAAATAVHVAWWFFEEEDRFGEEVTLGIPLSIHRSPLSAPAARAPALEGRLVVDGPCNLLALGVSGLAGPEVLRSVLQGNDAVPVEPRRPWLGPGRFAERLRAPPLTAAEVERGASLPVWIVYYEDRFHTGPARDSFAVAICLTEAEAKAELARRGRPVSAGADGYLVEGPHPLLRPGERTPEIGADAVRELLGRHSKSRGP